MLIENGMYVRDIYGIITKHNEKMINVRNERNYYGDLKSASFNIIDLVEIGDYVNGCRIEKIELYDDGTRYFYDFDSLIDFDSENIKSIVTHERFKKEEFEVVRC